MKNLETREPSFMRKVMQDSTIYDKEIQILAKWLCRGNSFLAEELRSEMHIAIMNMEEVWIGRFTYGWLSSGQ